MSERYILEPAVNPPAVAARSRVESNMLAFIARLPKNKCYSIEVCEYKKPRTNKQNSALYGLAEKKLMEFMGERGEAARKRIHEDLCCAYFGEVKTLTGRKPKRTTTKDEHGVDAPLNTQEMADFFDWIQQMAAELGCDIPDPDPMYRLRDRWNNDGQQAA